MVNAVCRASSDMSDKHIGALMVFEQETILGDIISSGTVIDAKVSPEMIGNIFIRARRSMTEPRFSATAEFALQAVYFR